MIVIVDGMRRLVAVPAVGLRDARYFGQDEAGCKRLNRLAPRRAPIGFRPKMADRGYRR